jgi:hypothetical protein
LLRFKRTQDCAKAGRLEGVVGRTCRVDWNRKSWKDFRSGALPQGKTETHCTSSTSIDRFGRVIEGYVGGECMLLWICTSLRGWGSAPDGNSTS